MKRVFLLFIVSSFLFFGCIQQDSNAVPEAQPPANFANGPNNAVSEPPQSIPPVENAIENDGGSGKDAPNLFQDSQIELQPGVYANNSISSDSDIDFYKFSIGAGDWFKVTVTPEPDVDVLLKIFDNGGKDKTWDFLYSEGGSDMGRAFTIDNGIAGKPESFWSQESSAQKNYTKYFSVEKKKGIGQYSIELEIIPQNDAESKKDAGDTPANAVEISANKEYTALLNYLDTSDCFKLSTSSNATVQVSPSKELDVSFTVRDQGGKDITWDLTYYKKTDKKDSMFSINDGVEGFTESIEWETTNSIQHICVTKKGGHGTYKIKYN